MRRKLPLLALASSLMIGGFAATSGPVSAGDGFARYLQRQARLFKEVQLREQARLRKDAQLREQARLRMQARLRKQAQFREEAVAIDRSSGSEAAGAPRGTNIPSPPSSRIRGTPPHHGTPIPASPQPLPSLQSP
jgi:hypothetical protein